MTASPESEQRGAVGQEADCQTTQVLPSVGAPGSTRTRQEVLGREVAHKPRRACSLTLPPRTRKKIEHRATKSVPRRPKSHSKCPGRHTRKKHKKQTRVTKAPDPNTAPSHPVTQVTLREDDDEHEKACENQSDDARDTPQVGERIMMVKEPWLVLILDGAKTMEIRGQPARPGPVWIGLNTYIYASAEIAECRTMTPENFEKTKVQHRHLSNMPKHAKRYGLLLTNIVPLTKPLEYYAPPRCERWMSYRSGPDDVVRRGRQRKRRRPTSNLQTLQEEHHDGQIPKDAQSGERPEGHKHPDDGTGDDASLAKPTPWRRSFAAPALPPQ